jgi:hypothetical protein
VPISERAVIPRLEAGHHTVVVGRLDAWNHARGEVPVHLRQEVDPFDLIMAGFGENRVAANHPIVRRAIVADARIAIGGRG